MMGCRTVSDFFWSKQELPGGDSLIPASRADSDTGVPTYLFCHMFLWVISERVWLEGKEKDQQDSALKHWTTARAVTKIVQDSPSWLNVFHRRLQVNYCWARAYQYFFIPTDSLDEMWKTERKKRKQKSMNNKRSWRGENKSLQTWKEFFCKKPPCRWSGQPNGRHTCNFWAKQSMEMLFTGKAAPAVGILHHSHSSSLMESVTHAGKAWRGAWKVHQSYCLPANLWDFAVWILNLAIQSQTQLAAHFTTEQW